MDPRAPALLLGAPPGRRRADPVPDRRGRRGRVLGAGDPGPRAGAGLHATPRRALRRLPVRRPAHRVQGLPGAPLPRGRGAGQLRRVPARGLRLGRGHGQRGHRHVRDQRMADPDPDPPQRGRRLRQGPPARRTRRHQGGAGGHVRYRGRPGLLRRQGPGLDLDRAVGTTYSFTGRSSGTTGNTAPV